ncbi:MAG TPA: hypothetical protein VK074_11625, partial [Fodinibius sp.]|nr:hypothetical protein [Fodinibius sp.]
GTFFYVGGAARVIDGYRSSGLSTDISGANWIRYLQTNIGDNEEVAGDGFGWSTSGLLTNSDGATGIAVFEGTNVTSSSVPIDAVFYGSEVNGALVGSNGYRIPEKSDLYSAKNEETGDSQPLFGQGTNIFMLNDAKDGNFRTLGGEFTKNAILKPRSITGFIDTKKDTKINEIESGPKVTKFKK